MSFIYTTICFSVALFCSQFNRWPKTIRPELRFLLSALTGYLAFSIFTQLKGSVIGHEEEFIMLFFQGPGHVFLGLIVLYLAFFGMFMSLVSASLFKSLLPNT